MTSCRDAATSIVNLDRRLHGQVLDYITLAALLSHVVEGQPLAIASTATANGIFQVGCGQSTCCRRDSTLVDIESDFSLGTGASGVFVEAYLLFSGAAWGTGTLFKSDATMRGVDGQPTLL